MRGEDWKRASEEPEDDGKAKFGRKAKAWFRRSLASTLYELSAKPECIRFFCPSHCGDASRDEWIAALTEWFMDRAGHFVVWVDYSDYRGKGYAIGAWQFREDLVEKYIGQAAEATRGQAQLASDAAACPTLDDWLRADIAGTLAYRGASGGTRAIPEETRDALHVAAVARERKRPRLCGCGESFRADRYDAVRCPKCREVARAQREAAKRRHR